MPIKDQCINCKHNTSIDSCAVKGINMLYDGISCREYVKHSIDFSKHEEEGNSAPSYENVNDNSQGSKRRMFQRPFSFKGRIRRTEYCLSYLICLIYFLPMNIMNEDEINEYFATFWLMLLIPMMWFLYAQGAKRCHDRDNSGWYQIIPYYFLWMMFAAGDDKENRYDESPK
jgi:uncharacterized membrane protein YhaH (DUF805 family)